MEKFVLEEAEKILTSNVYIANSQLEILCDSFEDFSNYLKEIAGIKKETAKMGLAYLYGVPIIEKNFVPAGYVLVCRNNTVIHTLKYK